MQIQFERLTDTQYLYILEILEDTRKRKHDFREILNMIFYVNRTSCQWRNISLIFPRWQIVYYYFRKFTKQGLWEKISQSLVKIDRNQKQKTDTPTLVCIDSQSVKSVQFSNEAIGLDGNKKVNGRKRHAVVDTLGNILCIVVHAANHFDGPAGVEVWDKFTTLCHSVKKVLADAGYRGKFKAYAEEKGYEIEIASRPPSERGFVPIKKRWVVERTFSWFNFFRRLDKDHEKTVTSSENMIFIAQIQILLNRNIK